MGFYFPIQNNCRFQSLHTSGVRVEQNGCHFLNLLIWRYLQLTGKKKKENKKEKSVFCRCDKPGWLGCSGREMGWCDYVGRLRRWRRWPGRGQEKVHKRDSADGTGGDRRGWLKYPPAWFLVWWMELLSHAEWGNVICCFPFVVTVEQFTYIMKLGGFLEK